MNTVCMYKPAARRTPLTVIYRMAGSVKRAPMICIYSMIQKDQLMQRYKQRHRIRGWVSGFRRHPILSLSIDRYYCCSIENSSSENPKRARPFCQPFWFERTRIEDGICRRNLEKRDVRFCLTLMALCMSPM